MSTIFLMSWNFEKNHNKWTLLCVKKLINLLLEASTLGTTARNSLAVCLRSFEEIMRQYGDGPLTELSDLRMFLHNRLQFHLQNFKYSHVFSDLDVTWFRPSVRPRIDSALQVKLWLIVTVSQFNQYAGQQAAGLQFHKWTFSSSSCPEVLLNVLVLVLCKFIRFPWVHHLILTAFTVSFFMYGSFHTQTIQHGRH